MRDIGALIWLRWRQFKDTAIYWLRVMGYQPNERAFSQNLYVVYLLLIFAFWIYTVGGFVLTSAVSIGTRILPGDVSNLLIWGSQGIFLAQVWVIMTALRSTPIKLSFADMAWVASSPIRRSAPVIVGFARQSIIRIVLLGIAFTLIAALVSYTFVGAEYGIVVARAVLVVIPMVVFTWGVGWAIGLLRLIDPRIGRLRFLWFLPLLLLPLAYYFPDPFMWMGRGIALVIIGGAPVWFAPLLVGLAVGVSVVVLVLGDRVNMVHAADESALYARIQALGLMAWRNPDIQRRIFMQMRQASRKPFLHLPETQGVMTFITRAGLSYLRHPDLLILTAAWGAAFTYFAVEIIVNNAPVQIWLLWLVAVGLVPPTGLLHVFQSDRGEMFLRQFLPVDGLQLLIADILLPLVVLILGAMAGVVLRGLPAEQMTLALMVVPIGALLVALSGAVALTTTRVLQTRLLATGGSFGAAIVAGVGLGTPLAGLAVALVAALIMAGMVAGEA